MARDSCKWVSYKKRFGYWWVVVNDGGYILGGGEWWWVMVDIFWLVVGGDMWWLMVVGGSGSRHSLV